jgi:hypothetical protein
MNRSALLRLAAYIAVAICASVAVLKISDQAIERERLAQIAVCERVQVLRDQANGTNVLVFDTFNDVIRNQKKYLAQAVTKEQKKQLKETLDRARHVVNTTTVTGPTDCHAAVDHPTTYKAPAPEFVKNGGKRIQTIRDRSDKIAALARAKQPLPPILDKHGKPQDPLNPR